jgi:FAD/FMN-containing dehydrogenase
MTPLGPDWRSLHAAVSGDVVLPDASAYDAARRPAIANYQDVRPQAVVRCATPGDVAETVGFARAHGVAIAARSGGHCFAGRSSTEGVVIDVGPMRASPSRQTASRRSGPARDSATCTTRSTRPG